MILKSKYNFLIPYRVRKLVRYGRKFDGGYLICEDASNSIENLITLGVGDDISFESHLEKKKKLKNIFLYDYTVSHYLFIKKILKYLRRFLTFRSSIKALNDAITNYLNFISFKKKKNVFFEKKKITKNKKNIIDLTLREIFYNITGQNNILKVDIEGDEYSIVDDILNLNKKINTLIIEFHWINKNTKKFIKKIKRLKKKFDIIHIHPNNYRPPLEHEDFFDVVEITFVNKSINKYQSAYRYKFPIKNLDFECFPHNKKIKFSFSK